MAGVGQPDLMHDVPYCEIGRLDEQSCAFHPKGMEVCAWRAAGFVAEDERQPRCRQSDFCRKVPPLDFEVEPFIDAFDDVCHPVVHACGGLQATGQHT